MKLRILSISLLLLLPALLFSQEKRWTEMTDKEQWEVLQNTLKLYDELDGKYKDLKNKVTILEDDNIKLQEKAKKYNKYKISTTGMILIDNDLHFHIPVGIGFEYRPFRYFSFGNSIYYDPVGNAAGFSVMASIIF